MVRSVTILPLSGSTSTLVLFSRSAASFRLFWRPCCACRWSLVLGAGDPHTFSSSLILLPHHSSFAAPPWSSRGWWRMTHFAGSIGSVHIIGPSQSRWLASLLPSHAPLPFPVHLSSVRRAWIKTSPLKGLLPSLLPALVTFRSTVKLTRSSSFWHFYYITLLSLATLSPWLSGGLPFSLLLRPLARPLPLGAGPSSSPTLDPYPSPSFFTGSAGDRLAFLTRAPTE